METNPKSLAPEPAKRLLHVYLVHGTWGRGFRPGKTLLGRPRRQPAWSEPGGYFHDDLKEALTARGLNPQMSPISWSGSNSVLERDRVAKAFAKLLDDDADGSAGCTQLVIGHSHGGNIALEAARRYRQATTELHIVTLATPFIDLWTAMKMRDGDRYSQEYGRAFHKRSGLSTMRRGMGSLAASCGLLWAGIKVGLVPPIGELLADPPIIDVMAFPFVHLLVTLFLSGTGAREDDLMRVPRFDAPLVPGMAQCHILVLRGTDDEAGLALAGGTIQALLGAGVSRAANAALAVASLFITALIMLPSGWRIAALVSIVVALALFLLGSLLEAIGRAAAGREFLLMGGLLGISVNSAPDVDGDVTIKTLAGSPSTGAIRDTTGAVRIWNTKAPDYRFKHGVYAHRDCIPAIIAWLAQRL
jgi:pimeloyl-ACP methyl ester carboxylesterase